MAVKVYVTLHAGPACAVEGLCPSCMLPALVEFTIYMLGTDGPLEVGTKRGCEECAIWLAEAGS